MKLDITKKPEYSSGKWRLTNEFGEDVYMAQRLETSPGNGVMVDMPVCDETKEGLVRKVLDMLALAAMHIRQITEKNDLLGKHLIELRGELNSSPESESEHTTKG